jgi:hypothetical protein
MPKSSYDPSLFFIPPQQVPANMPPHIIAAYQQAMERHIPPRLQTDWQPTPNFQATINQPTRKNTP